MKIDIKNSSGQRVFVKLTGTNIVPTTLNKDLVIEDKADGTYDITHIDAGRIYFSYGKALSTDAPDGANVSDPDYYTRFDKVELSYDSGIGGAANLTAVDFYAIPFALETSLIDDDSTQIFISQFTLNLDTTGNDLQQSIISSITTGQTTAAVIKDSSNNTVRVLSPVKAPVAYASLDTYVDWVVNNFKSFNIQGNYYGSGGGSYNYAATVDSDNITLTQSGNTIVVPVSSLKSAAINGSAIYTCNGPFTVNGNPATVSDNTIYSAVYRDLVTAFNLGYMNGKYGSDSSQWWNEPPYQSAGNYYNHYASAVDADYTGAYGFPFADRQKSVLANLGGLVDTLTITVLADDAKPTPISFPGVLNPQTTGADGATFNITFIFANNYPDHPEFTIGLNPTAQIGYVNPYITGPKGNPTGDQAAQVSNVTAQDGWNQYDLVILGKRYKILAKVSGGKVTKATIAGGGNSTLDVTHHPVVLLYLGGLDP